MRSIAGIFSDEETPQIFEQRQRSRYPRIHGGPSIYLKMVIPVVLSVIPDLEVSYFPTLFPLLAVSNLHDNRVLYTSDSACHQLIWRSHQSCRSGRRVGTVSLFC